MRPRVDRKTTYTRRMLGAIQTVSVRVSFKIIRRRAPVLGHLYFDDLGNLVLITGVGDTISWRRVFTTKELSQRTYRGHWMESTNVVREKRR